LYRIYQFIICLPGIVLMTIITAIEVGLGTTLGNGHFWGYFPGRLWGKMILKMFLIPVKVEGRENLEKDQSYVFVANHQGSFD
ncbi:1-acyl-sn-glycerol-3-phosphate acyltransferase, partial [Klebsiella pneumoniae]|nr:1-acyl-sn-glycerol-3-phosphate acyltransferase [Klebsiella pneumoniae]